MKKASHLSERGQGLVEYAIYLALVLLAILVLIVFLWRFLDSGQRTVLVFGIAAILFITFGSLILPKFISDVQAEQISIKKRFLRSNNVKRKSSDNTSNQFFISERTKKKLEILSYIAGIISCLIAVITFLK
jgi:fatty acid desaturase